MKLLIELPPSRLTRKGLELRRFRIVPGRETSGFRGTFWFKKHRIVDGEGTLGRVQLYLFFLQMRILTP